MCRPQYYAVSYSINPWMDPQDWASAERDLWGMADRQWGAFHDTLLNNGSLPISFHRRLLRETIASVESSGGSAARAARGA